MKTSFVAFVTISLCLSCDTFAQCNVSQPMTTYQSPVEAWTIEAWSGDNQSYEQIRDQINTAVANKQDMNALIQQDHASVQRDPNNPKLQYKYAYTIYRTAIETKSFNANTLIPVRDALQHGFPPHVYDYTRLRFLVESTLFPNQALIPVGRRLYNYNPQDSSVEFNLIQVLSCSTSASNLTAAVAYAQDLVHTKPKDANYHGNLAGVYLDCWFKTKNRSFAKRAIEQYQEYLFLAPTDAEYRKTATRLLKTLQQMVKK